MILVNGISQSSFFSKLVFVAVVVLDFVLCETVPAFAQEFKNSIASTDFDFITADDPSTFSELKFKERALAEMPDKRESSADLFQEAYSFETKFSDSTSVAIYIDASSIDQTGARDLALKFVHPLGKLPTALRRGVSRLCVHNGGRNTTAFSDVGLIVVYAENADVRIENHDLEETIFQESVHAAWDAVNPDSTRWKMAQANDKSFATLYAKNNPTREDMAETALFAFTILHHPDRLPDEVKSQLKNSIPARLLYISELLPPDKPLHFDISEQPSVRK
ncbi:MAG: hypothetical protein R3C03_00420 [Pirellulaceae bacterium]